MRVFWICALLFGLALVATLSLYQPQILAQNEFLKNFVTYEIMSFLIVIVTITFASVANIHLSIMKTQNLIGNVKEREKLDKDFAKPLQDETKSSAWLLFWALIVCAIAVFIKGEFPTNQIVISLVHGVAILVLISNAVVLHDIYSTVFALVGLER